MRVRAMLPLVAVALVAGCGQTEQSGSGRSVEDRVDAPTRPNKTDEQKVHEAAAQGVKLWDVIERSYRLYQLDYDCTSLDPIGPELQLLRGVNEQLAELEPTTQGMGAENVALVNRT